MDSNLIIIGLSVLVLVWGIMIYNGLVRGRNQIEAAWGQIDVQLKRRHDLIPNLVEVTKDAMDYERETHGSRHQGKKRCHRESRWAA